ncbi:MAG: hypothetical protein QM598_09845 [Protaetiibacter sp.]
MRRPERITMWTGAALVAVAVAASVTALIAQGARELEPPARPALIPSELFWSVFAACVYNGPAGAAPEGGISVGVVDHRMRIEVTDSALPPEQLASFLAATDECFARYPIEDERSYAGNSLGSRAERLLAYDVAQRWLMPCLEAHGVLPQWIPAVGDYLSDGNVPWYSYYQDYGRPGDGGLDDIIEARFVCGPGYQPYDS